MAYGKMANRYMSHSDLEQRLDSTICRYKDKPVYVRVDGAGRLSLFDPATMMNMGTVIAQIKPNDPDFDISSPEMGYMNHQKGSNKTRVLYTMRIPYRKYKQGVNESCIIFRSISNDDAFESHALYTRGFCDMLMEIYPSFEEAMRSLNRNETLEVAVSQAVALQRIESGLTLVYLRGKNVGWILPNKRNISLKVTEFSWAYRRTLEQLGWSVE